MRHYHARLTRLSLLTVCLVPFCLITLKVQQRRRDVGLMAAVQRYDYGSVTEWLRQGADPNVRDDIRANATLWQLLCESVGLRKRVTNVQGRPALLIAIDHHDLQIATALATRAATQINGRGSGMNEAVVRAAMAGYKDLAWLLIKRGAAQTTEEWTLLLAAAASADNLDIARYALAHGANSDSYSEISSEEVIGRPLSLAIEKDNALMAALLLEHGANADRVAPIGDKSHLTTAAQHGNCAIIRLLLAHGVQVNRSVRMGTALCFAAESGHLEAVKMLIDAGADVNYNGYGGSVLGHATNQQFGPEWNRVRVMRVLLARGAKVDDPVKGNWTALLSCAYTNQRMAAALLLDYGADVNHISMRGDTPLTEAASEGHYEMARLLLARGARLKIIEAASDTEDAKPKVIDALAVAKDTRMRLLLQRYRI